MVTCKAEVKGYICYMILKPKDGLYLCCTSDTDDDMKVFTRLEMILMASSIQVIKMSPVLG